MNKLSPPQTLVERWMSLLGLHRRSISKAAPLLGLSMETLSNRNRGISAVSYAERLAMTAALLGLPPFSDEMAKLSPERLAAAKAAGLVAARALSGEINAPARDPVGALEQ